MNIYTRGIQKLIDFMTLRHESIFQELALYFKS